MAEVKAPFNFIPASDKVFYPDWADQVSMDIPFKDSLDGYLDVTITAETPIFIKNGSPKDIKDTTFSHIDIDGQRRYFIPGTSVKGAIRSVMGIMSFGKMHINPKMRFAQREWNTDGPAKGLYNKQEMADPTKIKGGWLRKDEDGSYYIEEAKKVYRINHVRIDEYIGANLFEKAFSKAYAKGKLEEDKKLSSYKYFLLTGKEIENLRFEQDPKYKTEYSPNRVRVSNTGSIRGDLVLTGQPNQWTESSKEGREKTKEKTKFYEFVFEYQENEYANYYDLSREEYEQYKFIYGGNDVNDKTAREQWADIEKRVCGNGMPVFFRVKKADEETVLRDFGFTCMYKLPFEYTPEHFEKEREKGGKYDLPELIFGYTSKEEDSLRGRVQFSHFFSDNAVEGIEKKLILSGPKASYYPVYVRQNGKLVKTKYMTYNDENATLSGWKRYVNRTGIWEKCTGEPKQDTIMHPLKEGAIFKGRVVYHNLKPEELGALISSLTFHGVEGCFHQIGQGKPYGFGRVSVTVDNLPKDYKKYMAQFEIMMDQGNNDSWRRSKTINELIAMSRDKVSAEDDNFKYMELVMNKTNDFVKAKNEGSALDYYTNLRPEAKIEIKANEVKSEIKEEYLQKELEKKNVIISKADEMYNSMIEDIKNCNLESAEEKMASLKLFCSNNESAIPDGRYDYEKCQKEIRINRGISLKSKIDTAIESKNISEAESCIETLKAYCLENGIAENEYAIASYVAAIANMKLATLDQKRGIDDIIEKANEKTNLNTLTGNLLKAKDKGEDLSVYRDKIISKIAQIVGAMKPKDKKSIKKDKFKELADAIGATVDELITL